MYGDLYSVSGFVVDFISEGSVGGGSTGFGLRGIVSITGGFGGGSTTGGLYSSCIGADGFTPIGFSFLVSVSEGLDSVTLVSGTVVDTGGLVSTCGGVSTLDSSGFDSSCLGFSVRSPPLVEGRQASQPEANRLPWTAYVPQLIFVL